MKPSKLLLFLSTLTILVITSSCSTQTAHIIETKPISESKTELYYSFSQVCDIISSSDNTIDDSLIEVTRIWTTLNDHYKNKQKRKLLVFMDGTRNTKSSNTNVWQLYKLSLQQACSENPVIPYYVKGLGTDWYDAASGSIAGAGTNIKIRRAYQFLVQSYKKNDEIFLFGFSRGAFTARSLNGMLEYVGLLKSEKAVYIHTINKLYEAYNQYHDGTPLFLDNLSKNINHVKNKLGVDITHDVTVSAIGVFDTVPALGEKTDIDPRIPTSGTILFNNPSDHRTDLYAKKGFHALSLDEQRTGFQLFRFHNVVNDGQQHDLEEVWFAGGHKNIGGDNISNGLSKISLDWMLSKFKDYQIFPDNTASASCEALSLACEDAKLMDKFLDRSTLWKKGRVYKRWPRDHDFVHGSVFCRKNIDRLTSPNKDREPDGKYSTLNLKSESHYRIVPYQCKQVE